MALKLSCMASAALVILCMTTLAHAQGPYMVAYADTNCSGTVITGMDYPYFGGEEVPADVSSVSTFLRSPVNGGLANTSSPICALPEAGLSSPCTSAFTATRAGSMLYIQPAVAISVADAPACSVSRCQGGMVTVEDGVATGNFFDRASGEATFPVEVAAAADDTGAEVLSVTVTTPLPGVTCTLLFSVTTGSIESILGA